MSRAEWRSAPGRRRRLDYVNAFTPDEAIVSDPALRQVHRSTCLRQRPGGLAPLRWRIARRRGGASDLDHHRSADEGPGFPDGDPRPGFGKPYQLHQGAARRRASGLFLVSQRRAQARRHGLGRPQSRAGRRPASSVTSAPRVPSRPYRSPRTMPDERRQPCLLIVEDDAAFAPCAAAAPSSAGATRFIIATALESLRALHGGRCGFAGIMPWWISSSPAARGWNACGCCTTAKPRDEDRGV